MYYLTSAQIEMVSQETNRMVTYLLPVAESQLMKKKISFVEADKTLPELKTNADFKKDFWATDYKQITVFYSTNSLGEPIELTDDAVELLTKQGRL